MANNPWMQRRVIAYAHQGGAHEGPSSCLGTIAEALRIGATAIELDVHMTKDGHLMVCHDETVDRTTAASGAIANLTLEEVKALDNAYWWAPGEAASPGLPDDAYPLRGRAPKDHEYQIATLREVLERFPDTVLNMDIKQTAPQVVSYEQPLADLLREYDRAESVIVSSFSDDAVNRFRSIAPEFMTGSATREVAAFYFAVQAGEVPPATPSVALQVPETFDELVVVNQQFVDVAHEQGLAVHVWTINDIPSMERLLDLGVDGLISDVPTDMVRTIESRGLTWRGY